MPDVLLATKLFSPPLPARLMPRQSLLDQLHGDFSHEKRLILVCAPAGYGKTTLVCEWLQNDSTVSWVSLEKSDNDPRLFFSYVIASLRQTFPTVGGQAQELLKTPQAPPLQNVLSLLLNDLVNIRGQAILVLDDYQVIQSKAIHEGLTFLLDHLPPEKHIIITTRSDPALPLHRYRSRGQMLEVRAEALRFSPQEISIFMQQAAGVSLSASEIATLELRTEGWAAGLQMAAISLRSNADKERFFRSLTGTNRYILDYLLEEALKDQAEATHRFLMETAILDRLSAPLCSAVTKAGEEVCQEILENLERENLFVIPLDDERIWYRYHHLFQDLLTMRLKQSMPEKVNQLHRSAASWYESKDWMSEAVQHSIDGLDFERAADLVEQHTVTLFSQGKLDQLVGWIHRLPAGISTRRPSLSIHQAWALAFAGKTSEAESLRQSAIASMEQTDLSPREQKYLWAEIHTLAGVLAVMSGNHQDALTLAEILDTAIPPDSPFVRSGAFWALGYAWRMEGNLEKAAGSFREMLAAGRQIDNLWTQATAFADLGMVLRLSGRLREAENVYRAGLQIMQQNGANGLGFVGRLESFLAHILYEEDKLDQAEQLIAKSIAHNQLWNNPNHLAHAYWTQARILYASGDTTWDYALKKAEEIVTHEAVVPSLRAGIEALRARFWLAQGQVDEADRWMELQLGLEGSRPSNVEVLDAQRMAYARICIAQGKFPAAWKLLQEVESSARAGSRKNTLVEALLLKARAASNRATAVENVEAALALGIPEGYRRVFLDEGETLIPFLESLRDRSALVEPLIGARTKKSKAAGLLTARELDILRGMAEGLSNKEIGQGLFISAGTVKAHSAAIYRKLEVANRTAAIARAKDLRLL